MGPTSQSYVPISVKGAVLTILILLLLLAGKDSLLALVAGLAPLVFAGGGDRAVEPADEDDLDLLVERLHEVQIRAWRPLGAAARIIDLDHPDRGVWASADIPMPLVRQWPEGWPGPVATGQELTTADVDELIAGLPEHRRHLAVLGGEDTGKTSALLGLFLQAQHFRDARPTREEQRQFPLPLRISLARWPEDPQLSDETTLFDWMVAQLEANYPGLLAHGVSLEQLMSRLWDEDGLRGDRLMLFIDGIDTVAAERRGPLLHQLIAELRGRSVALAARSDTWEALSNRDRASWAELTLAAPGDREVARYLNPSGRPGIGAEFTERLIAGGAATAWLRTNPRLLQVLHEAYPERLPDWLSAAPAPDVPAPDVPAPDAEDPGPPTAIELRDALWNDLVRRTAWPNGVTPDQARSTLQWIAREGLFASTRFAWWEVPRAALADPTLTAPYRWLQWRRAASAMLWALTSFAVGLLVLTWLLWDGTVQGYDRASHGLQAAAGLSWDDVRQWGWVPPPTPAGLLATVVTNPIYLALGIAALVGLVTVLLARFGGEFEHEAGGQPQTIRLELPRWRDLRSLPLALHRRAAALVLATVVAALVLQTAGVGVAGQLWAGSVFAAVFLLVLAWLHWCAAATDDLTPAGTFSSDQTSSRDVALSLGIALSLVSTGLSWWFTAAEHVPTLGQFLWIIAAASTSIGLARGFVLGAGVGAPLLLQVRPKFGIGYAARLRLLEEALRRRPVPSSPVAVIKLLDLERTARKPIGGVADRPDPETLLRRVGPQIRLRESSLEAYLAETAAERTPDRPEAAGIRSTVSKLAGVLTLSAAAAVAILICTGMAAVVIPRLPCAQWNGLSAPGLLSGRPESTVWLENGQCVGFDVLGRHDVGQQGVFSARGVNQSATGSWADGAPEKNRSAILAQIAQQNAAIPDPDRVVTVLFLAPLTRTSGSNAINALWQLDGARLAQRAVNADRRVYVRLVVANAGENFTSGPSVVQAINRSFPRDSADTWAIKSVIGVAQSRSSAREALSQFKDVQIVAASVNGTDMRHGLIEGQDPDFGNRFVSVSPSDLQVATAMLDPGVLAQAAGLLPDPRSAPRLEVVRDPGDTYFSNDLANDLVDGITGRTTVPYDLKETATAADYQRLVNAICSAGNAQAIWMFAGRGNQLAGLDRRMPAGCQPVVIAGPGGISAVSASDVEGSRLTHMRNLFFYSLAAEPAANAANGRTGESDKVGWADAVARASDRATGYASVIEAVRRIPPSGTRGCPQPDPGVPQLGLNIDADASGDGHNTLAANPSQCGAPEGSAVYLCRFQSQPGRCSPVKPSGSRSSITPPPKPVVTAVADRGGNDPGQLPWFDQPRPTVNGRSTLRSDGLPWASSMQVLCVAPGETAHDGWVGVYVRDRGYGFVHWKVRYRQQNYYLRFSGPEVAGLHRKTQRLSAFLPTTCSTSAQLERLSPTRNSP